MFQKSSPSALATFGMEILMLAPLVPTEPLGCPLHHVSWGTNKEVGLKLLIDQILAHDEIYIFYSMWFYKTARNHKYESTYKRHKRLSSTKALVEAKLENMEP